MFVFFFGLLVLFTCCCLGVGAFVCLVCLVGGALFLWCVWFVRVLILGLLCVGFGVCY